MSLHFFQEVEFQTDHTSYGIGRVIAVYPATDEVKVLDEDGCVWRGALDQVSPIEAQPMTSPSNGSPASWATANASTELTDQR